MKRHDRYAEAQAFVWTADLAGVGAAARALGVAASVVTRRLQSLEARLSARLLERNTRRVQLTEAGNLYLPLMRDWLVELEEADAVVSDSQSAVRGKLRITVPYNFGRLHIAPRLPELLVQCPDLSLEVDFSDSFRDLVQERYDLAIRIGSLSDSALMSRKLADNRRTLTAAPAYLARAGRPQHPRELAFHSCLHFSPFREGERWRFERNDERLEIAVEGRMRANYGEALHQAALAGLGILQSTSFVTAPSVREGLLEEVLSDWRLPDSGIYAVWPQDRFLPSKLRTVIDYFVACFAGIPPWDRGPPTCSSVLQNSP